MARSFSEQEKEKIRERLLTACRQNWTQHGYKKTGIDELCRQAGISKGAFYLFFESKEALFCEVLCRVQEQIYRAASQILAKRQDRYGAAEALKYIYREYDENHFLYDADTGDYQTLKNRLSEEQAGRLEEWNRLNQRLFLEQPRLKLKVKEELAVSAIYSLVMTIRNKDVLLCGHLEVFDFMADGLAAQLYE